MNENIFHNIEDPSIFYKEYDTSKNIKNKSGTDWDDHAETMLNILYDIKCVLKLFTSLTINYLFFVFFYHIFNL